MNKRLLAASAAALLVVAGCSDAPEQPTPGIAGASAEPSEAEDRTGDPSTRERKRNTDGGNTKDRSSRSTNEGSGDNAGGGNGTGGGGSSALGGDGGSREVAAYPAAGRYVYAQEGFEEFCQTTSCEREDLPPKQAIEMSVRDRSGPRAVLVGEARSSGQRLTRTTFVFSSKAALITDVYTRFDYQNVSFEDSYHPDPPVEAMRFPLTTGESWSGRWKDKTSGRYSISVGRREALNAAGRSIEAFRIETRVTFDGQFQGTSTGVVWFDPATKSIVKSEGEMNIRSAFGRYRTEFLTTLESGPGY